MNGGLASKGQDRIDDLVSVRRLDDDALPREQRQRLGPADQVVREEDLHGRLQGQHDHLRDRRQRHDRLVRQRVVGKLGREAERLEGADLAAAAAEDAPGAVAPDAQSPLERNFEDGPTGVAHQRECVVVGESEIGFILRVFSLPVVSTKPRHFFAETAFCGVLPYRAVL